MSYQERGNHTSKARVDAGETEAAEENRQVKERAVLDEKERLGQELAVEKDKAERYLANWQRAQADFINYRRRTEQDKGETVKFANSTLILQILPVLDDLDRALASAPTELATFGWLDGIKLVYRKLKSILEAQGLQEMVAKGQCFDPFFHEAVMQGEGEEGMVIEEIQKGYKLHDRLLRPARVVVGSSPKDQGEKRGEV